LRIDPARLAVCGDSAGGNLAAVVALMARDSGAVRVSAQALVYPVVDCRDRAPSYARYGTGYGLLEADTVAWFMDRYLPDPAQRGDWRASPIRAALAGLPPTLVLTAECDVLHDEGVAFCDKLAAAGVPAQHAEFPGMIHGFFTYLGQVDDASKAHKTVANFLKTVWH
jgi:acetyl esterase